MNASSLAAEFKLANLDGSVIDHTHSDYHKFRKVWNGIADQHPAVVVRARSVGDVATVVRIAAEKAALLAVRCGGHSLPGLSTCDAGIVLDLSAMNDIIVDPNTRTAEVAGGALLGDLDSAGARVGLVTPAGVVSHTGVAGLTLGGGMGWLSRRFGLTIDNLLSADVVTADGQLIHASENLEPELYWGIRGGGGNFGVVTSFRFRMHPLGPICVGDWEYPTHECTTVLRHYRAVAASAPDELTSAFTLTSGNLSVTALWTGEPKIADEMLAPYGRLGRPLSGSLGSMTFLELQKRSDEHYSWGRRYYAKGGFLREVSDGVIDCLSDSIALSPAPDSELYVLQLGGAVSNIDENATAYAGRAAGYYWIAEPVWDEKADDDRCIAWGRMAAGRLAAHSLGGNYVNEQADFGKDVALSAYGTEKYRRLSRLKARYDPMNLFRLNQNIEPKP